MNDISDMKCNQKINLDDRNKTDKTKNKKILYNTKNNDYKGISLEENNNNINENLNKNYNKTSIFKNKNKYSLD